MITQIKITNNTMCLAATVYFFAQSNTPSVSMYFQTKNSNKNSDRLMSFTKFFFSHLMQNI